MEKYGSEKTSNTDTFCAEILFFCDSIRPISILRVYLNYCQTHQLIEKNQMVPNFHFAIEMKIRKHLYDELEKLAIVLV